MRRGGAGADPRPRRIPQPRDGGDCVPLRVVGRAVRATCRVDSRHGQHLVVAVPGDGGGRGRAPPRRDHHGRTATPGPLYELPGRADHRRLPRRRRRPGHPRGAAVPGLQRLRVVGADRPLVGLRTRTGHREKLLLLPNGNEVLLTARYLRSGRSAPVDTVVLALRDAEARRRAEADHAALISTISHELRSPLTGVKGFSSTLLRRWDRFSDAQKRLMLETIEADADRVTRLITELLDVSRIDSGRLRIHAQPLDSRTMLNRFVDRYVATGVDARPVHRRGQRRRLGGVGRSRPVRPDRCEPHRQRPQARAWPRSASAPSRPAAEWSSASPTTGPASPSASASSSSPGSGTARTPAVPAWASTSSVASSRRTGASSPSTTRPVGGRSSPRRSRDRSSDAAGCDRRGGTRPRSSSGRRDSRAPERSRSGRRNRRHPPHG